MLYPLEIGSTPHTEPHSEISEPNNDIDQSSIMNIEMIIRERKWKTLIVMNTNKLTPKERLLLRHRNLFING